MERIHDHSNPACTFSLSCIHIEFNLLKGFILQLAAISKEQSFLLLSTSSFDKRTIHIPPLNSVIYHFEVFYSFLNWFFIFTFLDIPG